MINIGNDAVNAIKQLRGNRDFDDLITALGVVVQTKVFQSLTTPSGERVDATAYAKGAYELWAAIHATHADLHPSQVKPPKMTTQATKAAAYAQ